MTYDQVNAAVIELEAEGTAPTADRILERLGRGSKRDVLVFLRAIRASAAGPDPVHTAVLDPEEEEDEPYQVLEQTPPTPSTQAPRQPDAPEAAPPHAGHAPRDPASAHGQEAPAPTRLEALRAAYDKAVVFAQAYAAHGETCAHLCTTLEAQRGGFEKQEALATSGPELRALRIQIEDIGFEITAAHRSLTNHRQGEYHAQAPQHPAHEAWRLARDEAYSALIHARDSKHALLGWAPFGSTPLTPEQRAQFVATLHEAQATLGHWIGEAQAEQLIHGRPDGV